MLGGTRAEKGWEPLLYAIRQKEGRKSTSAEDAHKMIVKLTQGVNDAVLTTSRPSYN